MEKKLFNEVQKLFEKFTCCRVGLSILPEHSTPLLHGEDLNEIRTTNSMFLNSTLDPKPKQDSKYSETLSTLIPIQLETGSPQKVDSQNELSPSLTDRIFAAEQTSLPISKSLNDHLFIAAELGDEETLRILCDQHQGSFKVDLNCTNLNTETPLHIASKLGHFRVSALLCKYGADLNPKDQSGRSPLHVACQYSHYRTVQVLIRSGATLHLQDNLGNTPLHYSISNTDLKSIKYFLNRFPDLSIKNNDSLTCQDLLTLYGIKQENNASVLESLISEEREKKEGEELASLTLQDFEAIQVLGKGSFAEVYLVKLLSTGELFAMKVLRKEKLLMQNVIRYAITERNILSRTNHPFIVKMKYAFQSEDKLYLVLNYCSGGCLSYYIAKEKHFTEDTARFFVAEIVLGIEELHRNNIIYRDLKPDNVLIDEQGHVQLTDFGLSKQGVEDEDLASSFCGSLAYLAPEMVKQSGHNKSVDWYLLGVLLYEMLIGFPPFYSVNKDQMFKNIETAKVRIPARVSTTGKNLIKQLLKRDPLKRLGSIKGAEEVKLHPFFEGVCWESVLKKGLKSPIVPKNGVVPGFVPKFHMKEKAPEELDFRHLQNWTFISK